ncbi:hypothetical protein QR685DRAFT_569195 [Neurospora intermedia]|uniref:F-box domain-containing protein n=1 Tax=Neurospora intermedia TaxID=5142 RepID=A0ABR3DK72_NEUIN
MTFPGFPTEIWWLIVDQAASIKGLSTMFLIARLNRTMARFALPLMYGIVKGLMYDDADRQSVCFWRSIIVSSLGKTLYPYCCWVKTLDFSDLLNFLQDFDKSEDAQLRDTFYSPPLCYLQLLQINISNQDHLFDQDHVDGNVAPHVLFCEVVNKITEGIKATVDQGHVTSHLAKVRFPDLEYLPCILYFPVWISRLTGLTTLHIHDISLLNEQVTLAIAENCSALKHFKCHIIPCEEAERQLSSLLQTLPPNTIESFTVIRGAISGPHVLKALDRHSGSLKLIQALGALNELQNCNALESLYLDAFVGLDFDFVRSDTAVYGQCVDWLQNCGQMTHLNLGFFPGGTQLLKDSLPGPKLRLKSLTLMSIEANAPWYSELHHQTKLEYLTVEVPQLEVQELGPATGRCQGLAAGISRCPELKELHTEEYLLVADISLISEGALKLEKISFSGSLVHDAHIMPLANLPRLKEVYVTGDSAFTASGILKFFKKMEETPDHDHQGFDFGAASQQGTSIGQREYKRIRKAAKRAFDGDVNIEFIDSDGQDYYLDD